MVTVDVALALICFAGECHPALLGETTPRGVYRLELAIPVDRRYGGDVLIFDESAREFFAVHRTWPGREKRYRDPPAARARITKGCINVEPGVYLKLRECCRGESLEIK